MIISLISAIANDGTIGDNGRLLWHIPEDLKWFRRVTMGKTIIMGRKTYESIGHPLPGRQNIILSRPPIEAAGCTIAHSPAEALRVAEQFRSEHIMVIGGAEIYALFMPMADTLYITHVHLFITGDTKFPNYDKRQWALNSAIDGDKYTFAIYTRVKNRI